MVKKKVTNGKKLWETNLEEKKTGIDLRRPVKTAAFTITGAGTGVLGAIAGVTLAGIFEIALPVGLCLWAGGITCGAIGMALGVGKKKKSR
ncbi:MAG TPA: hypothetical protein VMW39_05660 [bacterium]|nr:hypothetical protein [bacterium]